MITLDGNATGLGVRIAWGRGREVSASGTRDGAEAGLSGILVEAAMAEVTSITSGSPMTAISLLDSKAMILKDFAQSWRSLECANGFAYLLRLS